MESFSVKLKNLRMARSITQMGMAKILNVSRSCIANYESDRRQPDHAGLKAIADYFDVSTDYLMGRPESGDEKLQMLLRISGEVESVDKLNLCSMDTESKIALLKFYRYLNAMLQ